MFKSYFYRSERIGKYGKPFSLLKIKTLKDGTDKKSSFASQGQYLWYGKFLRKTKLDEFTQIINLLRGQLRFVGPRPEEARNIKVIPEDLREKLLSVRPGLTSLASVAYFNEEKILQQFKDPAEAYWKYIKPNKIVLDMFYVENRCFLLDVAILYMTFKKVVKSFFQ